MPSAYSSTIVQLIRGIPGAQWNAKLRRWELRSEQLAAALRTLAGVPTKLEIQQSFEFKPPQEEVADVDYVFRTKPYDHQRRGLALGAATREFAYLMEQGTGKTKTVVDLLSYLKMLGRVEGGLIIVPKAVLYSWQNEINEHSPLPKEERIVCVMEGSTKEKRALLNIRMNHAAFFITNYASLLSMEDDFTRLLTGRRLAMVLDESTAIKNHASKQAKACHRLGPLAAARYIMTGTPITQGPLDAFSQFKFLDPKILGHHNYYSFAAEYAIKGGFKGREVVGYRNLDRLASRIAPSSFRVLKKDCLDLPEKVYRVVELKMGQEQLDAYKAMKEESIVTLNGREVAAPVVLTRMLRLQQISAGFMPLIDEYGNISSVHEFPDAPKLDALVELVQEVVDGGGKAIVWCKFIWEVEQCMRRLAAFQPVAYYGETDARTRQANVDRFQTDSTCKVFVGQIQTGGIGITLTAANSTFYLTNSFSHAERVQSEDRNHRIGQRNTVTYTDLVVRGSLDRYVLRTLRDKKNIADVVNGDSLREAFGDA